MQQEICAGTNHCRYGRQFAAKNPQLGLIKHAGRYRDRTVLLPGGQRSAKDQAPFLSLGRVRLDVLAHLGFGIRSIGPDELLQLGPQEGPANRSPTWKSQNR